MIQEMVVICKALSDENRLRILQMLRSGEKCACKLLEELNISQPTLSHHMKILCDSGWLSDARRVNGCITPSVRKGARLPRMP